jgi:hypothetical protein
MPPSYGYVDRTLRPYPSKGEDSCYWALVHKWDGAARKGDFGRSISPTTAAAATARSESKPE